MYSTCRNPAFQCRILGLCALWILVTMAWFDMMSIDDSLWSNIHIVGKIIELLNHLGEEEMVLIPGVKVIERVHQHGVGVFVRSAFATVRLAYSPALRILSLLVCPFPP